MEIAAIDLPYERQEDDWKCGAASLCMVYRSFAVPCSQAEVWPKIARDDFLVGHGAATYRLGSDALRRGLGAVVVQARDPWGLLHRCIHQGLRLIVNQQLRRGSTRRHFAVVSGVADDHVILHDPYFGPGLRYSRADFLDIWGPSPRQPAMAGYLLVALDNRPPRTVACDACGTMLPVVSNCPECNDAIALHPAHALGCVRSDCPGATWTRFFCPHCDARLASLTALPADYLLLKQREDNAMPPGDELGKLASAFEKYQAVLGEVQAKAPPGDARHQLQSALEQMNSSFAQLKTEFENETKRMEEARKAAKERKEAAQKKVEEAAKARKAAAEQKASAQQAKQQAQAIDPHLAEKLRSQLLEEFGRPPQPAGHGTEREWDWDDWPRGDTVTR